MATHAASLFAASSIFDTLAPDIPQTFPASLFSPVDGLGAVAGFVYRMRGTDGGVHVYWESVVIDSAGVDYPGPGPLTDIVVSEVIPS